MRLRPFDHNRADRLLGANLGCDVHADAGRDTSFLELARCCQGPSKCDDGAHIAVGQLQKYAGPDARITIRGDWQSATVNQPYLTGIWNKNTNTIDTWLVSGNENSIVTDPATMVPSLALHNLFNDANSGPEGGGGEVALVDEYSVPTTGNDVWGEPNIKKRIVLDKQKIKIKQDDIPGMSGTTDATIGHYAYWIGDEGMKASIALTDAVSKDYANRIDYNNSGTYSQNWGRGSRWHR